MKMSFWQYCEKVNEYVTTDLIIKKIDLVRNCWLDGKTLGQCVHIVESDLY